MNRLKRMSLVLVAVSILLPVLKASAQVPTASNPAGRNEAPALRVAQLTSPPASQTSGTSTFQGSADLPGAVQIATNFSPDKQAATVIFRNLLTDASGSSGQLVGTRLQTVVLPMNANGDKPLHVTQDIRGFVTLQGKARAALLVQSGGTTTVVDLNAARIDPKAQNPAKPLSESRRNAVEKSKAFANPQAPARQYSGDQYDFARRIEADVPAGSAYHITLILLVERDVATNDANGLLSIDSLDVEIAKTLPATSSR